MRAVIFSANPKTLGAAKGRAARQSSPGGRQSSHIVIARRSAAFVARQGRGRMKPWRARLFLRVRGNMPAAQKFILRAADDVPIGQAGFVLRRHPAWLAIHPERSPSGARFD
jgi:hypothetical protein